MVSSTSCDKFKDIIIPNEHVVEKIREKRKTSARKFYPGYLLIKMEINYKTWNLVNSTTKVTAFLGNIARPIPISDSEMKIILEKMKAKKRIQIQSFLKKLVIKWKWLTDHLQTLVV